MSDPSSQSNIPGADLEEVLRTYPLAPLRRSLTPAVLARIRTVTPAPHFRLEWMDLALGLFGMTLVGLAYFFWRAMSSPAVAQTTTQAELQFFLFQQQLSWLGISPGLVVSLGGIGLAGLTLAVAGWFLVPRWRA